MWRGSLVGPVERAKMNGDVIRRDATEYAPKRTTETRLVRIHTKWRSTQARNTGEVPKKPERGITRTPKPEKCLRSLTV
jgi:hypothetical protein